MRVDMYDTLLVCVVAEDIFSLSHMLPDDIIHIEDTCQTIFYWWDAKEHHKQEAKFYSFGTYRSNNVILVVT